MWHSGSASGAAGPCGWGRGGEEQAQESGYNRQRQTLEKEF